MNHRIHYHHGHHLTRRAAVHVRGPVQGDPVDVGIPPPTTVLLEPHTLSLDARTEKCTDGSKSNLCEKPQGSNTLPIVLGAAIPLVIAVCVLVFLHRRHLKKQKLEDLNDKHKSLDFGLEDSPGGQKAGKSKAVPEMAVVEADNSSQRPRGMSMDMSDSPYLLPAQLHGSRESFHSLSRSVHDHEDPYRGVNFVKSDADSIRSFQRQRADNASVWTGSSGGTDRMNANLLRNAQRMSTSAPPRAEPISPTSPTQSPQEKLPQINVPESSPAPQASQPKPEEAPATGNQSSGLAAPANDAARDSYFEKNAQGMRSSANYLGSLIHSREPSTSTPSSQSSKMPSEPAPKQSEQKDASPSQPVTASRHPPRMQSMQASVHEANTKSYISDTSDYGDGFKVTPPSPRTSQTSQGPNSRRRSLEAPMTIPEEETVATPKGLAVQGVEYEQRRLSMSLRPLPIDDPTEDPEQRANRIRSFYKEYFDESKPDPVGQYGDYYEDYGQEYLDGAIFDEETGQWIVAGAPFAQPVTRRAMTPPPRAPPRFNPGGPRGRSSSNSTGRFMPPRGQSAMSDRGRSRQPRKPMPPPSPLSSLPTPHLLKEDSMVFNPIDFAPPSTFRDRQAGRRPDSPMGVQRPYSPAVRPHTPLASAFDELSVIPSPHALRRSGTFTALDFAPRPRFMTQETASDAGSIRSNRSGISAVRLQAVRGGAYRVSRIPKEVVGTRDDLTTSLKPKMQLWTPA